MLRIALIGVSGYGRQHLKQIEDQVERGHARLTAATIINREVEVETTERLEAAGCRVYRFHEEMFAAEKRKIDLCCIPTGIHWHTRMAVAALEAGAHVYVEKPLAATIDDVSRIQEAQAKTGRVVAVGFQDLHAPETHAVKKWILDGRLGEIRGFRCYGLWPRSVDYYHRNTWAGRLRDGAEWVLDSPVNNALAHFLNLMLFLAGDTAETTAEPASIRAELYRAKHIESFDTAAMEVTTRNGRMIRFYVTHSCQEQGGPEIAIDGTQGSVLWRIRGNPVLRENGGAEETVAGTGWDEMRTMLMDDIVQRCKGEDRFVCTPEIARAHTLCVNALHARIPIHDVIDRHCKTHHRDGSDARSIVGVEEVIRNAYQAGRLLHDEAIPWTRPAGETGDLADFTRFTSCYS